MGWGAEPKTTVDGDVTVHGPKLPGPPIPTPDDPEVIEIGPVKINPSEIKREVVDMTNQVKSFFKSMFDNATKQEYQNVQY